MHQTLTAGGAALKVCDYLGESLANLFGITTPKYEYEIEEYKRTMQQVNTCVISLEDHAAVTLLSCIIIC
jgi:hypothetical protein